MIERGNAQYFLHFYIFQNVLYFSTFFMFFNTLSPFWTKSQHVRRKADTIFQMIFNLIHSGNRKTPMHQDTSVRSIHDTCRSKKFAWIMNNLGLYTSYDKIERVDTVLEQLTIHMAGSHRVPVTPSVVPHELVHGAMESLIWKETQFLASVEATTLSSCYFKTLKIPNFGTNSYR